MKHKRQKYKEYFLDVVTAGSNCFGRSGALVYCKHNLQNSTVRKALFFGSNVIPICIFFSFDNVSHSVFLDLLSDTEILIPEM